MANPILQAAGGNQLAFTIEYPSCCGANHYNFFSPNNQEKTLFHGKVHNPTLFGSSTLKIKDTKDQVVCEPVVMPGCCGSYSVEDGSGTKVGSLSSPTRCQRLTNVCCDWNQAVFLRVVDSSGSTRYSLRNPRGEGCKNCCKFDCCTCLLCQCQCCRPCQKCCQCCKCKCSTQFKYDINVYSGDTDQKEPIAHLNWTGITSGCTGSLKNGCVCTVTFPNGCSYNDACLLLLLAVWADVTYIAPSR